MRFATAACMQKYGNVSFATVACAKCMRYGGRGGDPYHEGGGGWQHGTRNHIYIYYINYILYIYVTFGYIWNSRTRVTRERALLAFQARTSRKLLD